MTIAELPLEVWELILSHCPHESLLKLRSISASFKEHIERRILPNILDDGDYEIPSVEILLFNGFHQYRSSQRLRYCKLTRAYNPMNQLTTQYVKFSITDPLRYFKINRIEDIAECRITRPCDTIVYFRESVILRKRSIKKYVMIGEDEQSILIPVHLLIRGDWELEIPCMMPNLYYPNVVVEQEAFTDPDEIPFNDYQGQVIQT